MDIGIFLKNIDLFKDLREEQIAKLAKMTQLSDYEKGQHIFYEGDQADGFFVVHSGRVKIFKLSGEGKEQILHVMEPGDPFGEVPMFTGDRYPADAEAVEPSKLLFFSRKSFTNLISREPSLAMGMMATLSRRLLHLTTVIENLSLKEVPERLASYLLYLHERDKGTDLDLRISKGHLANILGTSPETLSRTLGKLSSRGVIKVQGRNIRLLDLEAMKNIATGQRFKG
jgi:CRP-like cAMP-binding protein